MLFIEPEKSLKTIRRREGKQAKGLLITFLRKVILIQLEIEKPPREVVFAATFRISIFQMETRECYHSLAFLLIISNFPVWISI